MPTVSIPVCIFHVLPLIINANRFVIIIVLWYKCYSNYGRWYYAKPNYSVSFGSCKTYYDSRCRRVGVFSGFFNGRGVKMHSEMSRES